MDIAKALIDYVSSFPVETLVLGAPSRSGFVRYQLIKSAVLDLHAYPQLNSTNIIIAEDSGQRRLQPMSQKGLPITAQYM